MTSQTRSFTNFPLPDLVVTNISWSPSHPKIFDSVTINFTIENRGEGNASGFIQNALYIDDQKVNGDKICLEAGLAAGAVEIRSFTHVFDTKGTHTIKVVADATWNNKIVESDENNNVMNRSIEVSPWVSSREYGVGFKVGDWAEYDNGDKILITEINGTNVTYEVDGGSRQIDVNYCRDWFDPEENWGKYPLIIASDIDVGERVYNSYDAPVIGGVSESFVAGAIREVSHLYIWRSIPGVGGSSQYTIDLYYDKMTGFMVNVTFRARGLNYEVRMVSTNLWEPEKQVYSIAWDGVTYITPIDTNSTISSFTFNQAHKEIRFNIAGLDGTKGYCNVTIPMELLNGEFTVLLNGTSIDYTLTQNSTHSFIYFEYTHSTHEIQIIGTTVIPEFPSIISYLIILTVLSLTLIFAKRRLRPFAPNVVKGGGVASLPTPLPLAIQPTVSKEWT